MKKRFFFPIAIKASVFFILVLLVTLLGTSFYIYKESNNTIENMIKNQFNQALNMAQNHFELLEQMNRNLINNLAEDHELIKYLTQGDIVKLEIFIADKVYDTGSDQIILLDNSSNIITQFGGVPFEGTKLQNLEIVEQTLTHNKQFTTIVRQYDVFVLYASAPIIINNKRQGIILMGFSINSTMMQNIKKDTEMQFSIIGDRSVAATSFIVDGELIRALPMPYLDYLWLLKYPDKYYEARIGERDYYLTARYLKNLDKVSHASLLMAYPSVNVQKHEQDMIDAIVVSSSIAILFSIIILFIFAKRVSKIFHTMVSYTKKIAKGEYDHTLEVNTKDELEIISRSFNSMTKSLSKQRKTIVDYAHSLESKVEERTKELDEQKESLSQILDLHPSMIFTIEKDKIIYANRVFLKFFHIDSINSSETRNNLCKIFRVGSDDCKSVESIRVFIESLFKDGKNIITLRPSEGIKNIFEVEFISIADGKEIVVFKDITRLSSENQRLEEQSIRDVLTGQYNRVKFNHELDKALSAVKRHGNAYSLVICDIDNFKVINDTYGHVVGDYALVKLSEIFFNRTRITDIFARWGGEEFVLLLSDTEVKEAELFCNSLRESLAAYHFDYFERLTCSFGVTKIMKDDTVKGLLSRVDEGLYYSKEHGKDRVTVV